MSAVTIARFSSLVAAAGWLVGLPVVVMTAVLFVSDTTYFLFGVVVTVLGVTTAPIVFSYPAGSPVQFAPAVKGLGVLACVALVVSGTLLVGASAGLIGAKAPGWIPGAAAISLTGFFVWVLFGSYSTRRSALLGPLPFWLGLLAATSWLVATLVSVVITFHTDTTLPIDMIFGLLIWLCLPAWLIALAMRMRPDSSNGKHAEVELR